MATWVTPSSCSSASSLASPYPRSAVAALGDLENLLVMRAMAAPSIGAWVSTYDGIDGTQPFTGELAELMIFRSALTQPQIQALGMSQGLTGLSAC
jgi:hypothetical protein